MMKVETIEEFLCANIIYVIEDMQYTLSHYPCEFD